MQPQVDPIIEKDPVEDRDEFEMRIKRSSCWKEFFSMEEVLNALIDEDTEKLAEIRAVKNSCEEHVNGLLKQYDEASDKAAKAAVVGSVRKFKRS